MATKRAYVVRSGDYLTKLASTLGFDADAVWNDPANEELKAQRPNPEILAPGDVLIIPEPSPDPIDLHAGTSNSYEADVPKVHVALAFSTPGLAGEDDEPLADEPYVVLGLGEDVEGTTSGDGQVEFDVPVTVREVTIEFPDRGYRCPVGIGDIDPNDEPSGVRQRLQNLGYHLSTDPDEAHAEEEMRLALLTFQRSAGLEPSGVLDDATRDAILQAHGI
jgi:hypothetical protein